jgi:hypothetical protein
MSKSPIFRPKLFQNNKNEPWISVHLQVMVTLPMDPAAKKKLSGKITTKIIIFFRNLI